MNNHVTDCSVHEKMCRKLTDQCYESYCHKPNKKKKGKKCPEFWDELSYEYFDDFESNCKATSEDGHGGIVMG